MNRKIFYPLLIGLLIISNLATLYFVMQKGKHKHFGQGPKKVIIEKLDFDENQIVAYEKLIDQHRIEIRAKDQKIIQIKKELYRLLNKSNSIQETDSLTKEIGREQQEIERIHFNHFKDIKSICKPEQISYFELLVDELDMLFNKNIHPRKP
jgi:Spy/CpxP family protein refolding chaperone